jgi:hypothetical protein
MQSRVKRNSTDLTVNPNCFIYGQMTPYLAGEILLRSVRSLSEEKLIEIKQNLEVVWLLRESRQDGMLTIHSASWYPVRNVWSLNEPRRVALTPDGWVDANLTDENLAILRTNLTKVKAEDFANNAVQLLEFLRNKFHLKVKNRINPEKKQQSDRDVFTSYGIFADDECKSKRKKSKVSLPEDINFAITCALTKKTFLDPVVCRLDDLHLHLHRGESYERAKLEEMKLDETTDFYPNHKLKSIINYLGAQYDKLKKLEKINDSELIDAIYLERINDSVITPAGQSYSRLSIEEHLNSSGTKDPINPSVSITKPSLVPNSNLDIFISGWDRYYVQRSEDLKKEEKPHAPSSSPS